MQWHSTAQCGTQRHNYSVSAVARHIVAHNWHKCSVTVVARPNVARHGTSVLSLQWHSQMWHGTAQAFCHWSGTAQNAVWFGTALIRHKCSVTLVERHNAARHGTSVPSVARQNVARHSTSVLSLTWHDTLTRNMFA